MECREALPMMHEYLDGDLEPKEVVRLKEHMLVCAECRDWFRSMERTEALVGTLPEMNAPEGLAERIMQSLPPAKRKNRWFDSIKRHPAISVAAVFAFVMLGSYVSMWNQDKELLVKGDNLDQLIFQNNTVYVPAGTTVNGDLTVKGGKIVVEGDIKGDLVVINGEANLASTAKVGHFTKIDEAFSWLWYKVGEFFTLISE